MPSYTSNISRLLDEIARLRQEEARELSKESDLTSKLVRARDELNRTKSSSTMSSKLRDVERFTKEIALVAKRKSDIASKLASKTKDLQRYEERQASEQEKARKKVSDEQKRLIRERGDYERRLASDIRSRSFVVPPSAPETVTYDFFISHASEDKEDFVESLAIALRDLECNVFYDGFTLKIGDSLRRKIDQGLANSRFGIVVLSEHFFRKEWPQRELDGLVARETGGTTRILPIWHKISKDEVAKSSPTLADKIALNTSLKSVAEIARELRSLLNR